MDSQNNSENLMQDEHMNEAKKQTKHRTKKKNIFMLTASIAAFLLAGYLVMEQTFPDMKAESRFSPEMKKYIEVIDYDKTLMIAAENNLLQEYHTTDSSGDYALTVGGVIADEEKAVVLYSVSGPELMKNEDEVRNVELIIGKDLPHSVSSGALAIDEEDTSIYRSISLNMQDGEVIPKELKLELEIQDQQLKVIIPVDHSRFSGMRENIDINKEIVIDSQKVLLHDMEVLPLKNKIRMETFKDNKNKVNSLIGLSLADDNGNKWSEIMNGIIGSGDLSEGTYTAYMESTYFEQPNKLFLAMDGAYISEKDGVLVINTEKGEIVEAPDDQLKLIEVNRMEDHFELSIQYEELEPAVPNHARGYQLFEHKGSFTDAAGIEYQLLDRNGTKSTTDMDDKQITYINYYSIPKEKYEQPLTFKLDEYPGYIKHRLEVPLY
ncbi:DUF4179 domain-containing protein [Neobacillus mesonae]|nr:DUF4179 domain-containing protein [Neobacillus mesonae]